MEVLGVEMMPEAMEVDDIAPRRERRACDCAPRNLNILGIGPGSKACKEIEKVWPERQEKQERGRL